MVPLLQWATMRRPPQTTTWIGIALAFIGLALLAGPDAFHLGLGIGEIATLFSAVAIAGEIILIGRFASVVDSSRVTVVQLLVGGGLSFAAMPFAGEAIEAALTDYERDLFPRAEVVAQASADNLKRFFSDDAPHSVIGLFSGRA